MAHGAPRHSYAGENSRLHEVFPRLSGNRLDHLAGHKVEHVVIRVRTAKTRGGFDIAQPARDLFAVIRGRRPPEEIAGAESQTAAMHEEVADRELARDEGVVHRKARQVVDDRRVPAELSVLDQDPSAV